MPAILKKDENFKDEEIQNSNVVGQNNAADESPQGATPLVQVKLLIDKKIRNLEKRKTRLEQLKSDLNHGKTLTEEQMKAVERINDVEQQIDLAKELQKNVLQVVQLHKKQQKLVKRNEYRDQCDAEMSKIRQLLAMQEILDALGKDSIRQQFVAGVNGAIKLTEEELGILDEIYQKICPSREDVGDSQAWSILLQESSQFIHCLLNCSSKLVPGKALTFKMLRGLIDKIATCEYFNNKISRCQSPEPAESETSSVNDECNGRTLLANNDDTSSNISMSFEKKVAATLPPPPAVLPPFTSPSQSQNLSPSKDQPPLVLVQDGQTGIFSPVEATGAPFAFDPHAAVSGSEVLNTGNHPLAYCSNGQEPFTFVYAQQPPYVTIPATAFVDTYTGGYANIAPIEQQQCQTSPLLPPPYIPSSKSLDPNAPTFISRAVNWVPVMWPNHTTIPHQEISSDEEAIQTYDALQGIVEIVGSNPESVNGEAGTTTDSVSGAVVLTTGTTAVDTLSGITTATLDTTNDEAAAVTCYEEIVDPTAVEAVETMTAGFNEMTLQHAVVAAMLENRGVPQTYCGQMAGTMFEPEYHHQHTHSVPTAYWYNYNHFNYNDIDHPHPPCI